jgi:copper ion binding protein
MLPLLLGVILLAPPLAATPPALAADDAAHSQAVVTVSGMACPFCAYGLKKHLIALPGVKDVHVDLGKSQVTIEFTGGSHASDAQIQQAVRDAGFTPGEITWQAAGAPPSSFKSAEFNVEGMRCEYCAAEITTTLERYKGVKSADVDLTANRATVIYDSRAVTPQALAEEGR